MRDTAKQIINYWYSLECLQPKEVSKYKVIPKKYVKELVFTTVNDRTTIYQQSVIKPLWKKAHVSTYVVPLPNYSYNYSIFDEIKSFKNKKDYVLDDEHAVLLSVVKGTEVLEAFIIVFRLVRDVVANHKTTRYAGAATKVIQKNHLA